MSQMYMYTHAHTHVQELVSPDTSFVLHTARPSDGNTGVMMAELAPGQGETLASGTRGSPWRFEVDKATGQVNTKAFANFSRALVSPAKLGPGASRAVVRFFSQQLIQCPSNHQNQIPIAGFVWT